ncbi:MAG: PAS-domain containing protein [Vitreoscilla sp.]|nr:PAS-domain containing protein [Vitreoscilla sp.]
MSNMHPTMLDPARRHDALQSALDLIDQGFTLIDGDLRMVAWNQAFLRLLGFPSHLAFIGAPFETFIRFNAERGDYGPGDPAVQTQTRVDAARSFEAHDFERIRPDGTVLRVRGFPVPAHGFVTLYSDITEQRAAEQKILGHAAALEHRVAERTTELRRSEAQMRLITDSIPALIAYVDAGRTYRYINKGYQLWFGLDPATPEKASAKEFLGPETYAGIRPHVMRALAGEAVTFEYQVNTVGGQRLHARTTLIPDFGDGSTPLGCYELTFDITEQKQAQAMLVQAQKMEALGQLTGGLAHDFNNILTVILGNLKALAELRPADDTVSEHIVPAMEAANRGADLIKGLMSFSRKQALESHAVEVGALVQSVGRLVRRSLPESLRLDVQAGNSPVWAWTDPGQLQNSLLNLILNARDASQGHGVVSLCVAVEQLEDMAARSLGMEAGPCVCIDVQDSGCGMSPQTMARAFEPFFTTKQPGIGTGLGLAMVYGFVKQTRGAISISSEVGVGTCVRVRLPVHDINHDAAAVAQLPAPSATVHQGLALLVEDDADVRTVVRRALLALGYSVLEAETGTEAMTILDQTPHIELVLTDVVMPGGVDGHAVARHALHHCGVERVALMSGYAPEHLRSSDLPILSKPFSQEQLARWLATVAR